MTAVETIAFIFIIVGLVKLLVLTVNPAAWMNIAKKIWRKTPYLSIIFLALAVLVFYYLLQELSVLQILAVSAFVALLFGMQFSRYSKEAIGFAERIMKKKENFWKNNWLYGLIWLALLVFG